MVNSTSIITRKIQLHVDIPRENKQAFHEAYQKLYSWVNISYRAANIIASHLYCQHQIKDLIYLTEGVKMKLLNNENDKNGILTTSHQNSAYKVLSNRFKNKIPADIMACLCHFVYLNHIKEKVDYNTGRRSLRSYKQNLPVPFYPKNMYNIHYDDRIQNFRFLLFKNKRFSVPLRTYLGKDYSNNKVIIERCLRGLYKICNSSYKIIDGKIYLFLSLQVPTKKINVNPEKNVEAVLSFLAPIIAIFNNEKSYIGDKQSYIYKRLAIQNGFKRRQKLIKYNTGGKGRKLKLKGLEEFKKKEQNFVNNYTHKLSHELIKFCINKNAGKLTLKGIEQNIREAKENQLLIRNWSFGNLIHKIEYKCKLNGIELIKN